MSCFTCVFEPCLKSSSSRNYKPKYPKNHVYNLDFQQISTETNKENIDYTQLDNMLKGSFNDYFVTGKQDRNGFKLLGEEDNGNRKASDASERLSTPYLSFSYDDEEEEEEEKQQEKEEDICLICFEVLDEEEVTNLSGCKCRFHTTCLKAHVKEGVRVKAFPIKCPGSECMKGILQRDLHGLLEESVNQTEKYKKFYKDFIVESYPSRFVSCPDVNCQYATHIQGKLIDKQINCEGCKKRYCMECKLWWHGDISCKKALQNENKRKNKEIKEKEKEEKRKDNQFLAYSKKSKFKRCPHCGQVIEKVSGCQAVTCTRCKGMFCYTCRKKGDGHGCKHRFLGCSMF